MRSRRSRRSNHARSWSARRRMSPPRRWVASRCRCARSTGHPSRAGRHRAWHGYSESFDRGFRSRRSAASMSSADASGDFRRAANSFSRRGRWCSRVLSRCAATWIRSSAARSLACSFVSGPATKSNGAPAITAALIGSRARTSAVFWPKGPTKSVRRSSEGTNTNAAPADI